MRTFLVSPIIKNTFKSYRMSIIQSEFSVGKVKMQSPARAKFRCRVGVRQ